MDLAVVVLTHQVQEKPESELGQEGQTQGPWAIRASCPYRDEISWHLALPITNPFPAPREPQGPWHLHYGPKGRGSQLDTAISKIDSEHYFVLHADSQPDSQVWKQIKEWCQINPHPGWGSFVLSFGHPHPWLRFLETFISSRTRKGLPLGDQGLWLNREMLVKSGGYQHLPLMEDFDLGLRLKALSGPCLLGEGIVTTSPRRYLDQGPFNTSVKNFILRCRFQHGEDPAILYRDYYGED